MIEKTARVRAVEPIAPGVVRVDLAMVEPGSLDFRPGQFVSVRLPRRGPPGAFAAGRAARRSFSIASPAARTTGFELILRADGAGESARFASALRPDHEVQFFGPMGFFSCAAEHRGDVVFVATGVGVAPMFPMLDEVLARPARVENGRVHLYWGVRREADLFFIDRLEALTRRSQRFQYTVSLSSPPADWTGPRGRITTVVLAAAPTFDDPIYYLCGRDDMIRDVTRGLERLGGHDTGRVRSEAFSATVAVG